MADDFRDGDRVRINTGLADDQGQVDRNTEGRVLGANPVMPGSDGRPHVNVQLRDGQVVAVPSDALERRK